MSPVARILKLVRLEKAEISVIYFYAIMAGLNTAITACWRAIHSQFCAGCGNLRRR